MDIHPNMMSRLMIRNMPFIWSGTMSEMIMMMNRKGTWEKISMRRCMPRSNMPPK